MTGFEWISDAVGWVGQFIPRWRIVETTRGAVKFVRGSKVVVLGPGWHVYWPVMTLFEDYPTARQGVALRAQTLVTTDDKVIAVGGLIVYEIRDLEAIVAHTFDPDETIRDITLSAIHDVCCRKTWDELKAGQRSGRLDVELRQEAAKGLGSYGVKVLKVTLTDLAPCRVLKLIQTMAKEGA